MLEQQIAVGPDWSNTQICSASSGLNALAAGETWYQPDIISLLRFFFTLMLYDGVVQDYNMISVF